MRFIVTLAKPRVILYCHLIIIPFSFYSTVEFAVFLIPSLVYIDIVQFTTDKLQLYRSIYNSIANNGRKQANLHKNQARAIVTGETIGRPRYLNQPA